MLPRRPHGPGVLLWGTAAISDEPCCDVFGLTYVSCSVNYEQKKRAPLDQISPPKIRMSLSSFTLTSLDVWKVSYKLWAIPACCEPGPITYNHLSHPSYCSPSVTLLPFSSLQSFWFFYMSLSCPQRWKICKLHYWEQLKITLSTSVYLLSISSNMDITCFPTLIQPCVNSASRPPHFKRGIDLNTFLKHECSAIRL